MLFLKFLGLLSCGYYLTCIFMADVHRVCNQCILSPISWLHSTSKCFSVHQLQSTSWLIMFVNFYNWYVVCFKKIAYLSVESLLQCILIGNEHGKVSWKYLKLTLKNNGTIMTRIHLNFTRKNFILFITLIYCCG